MFTKGGNGHTGTKQRKLLEPGSTIQSGPYRSNSEEEGKHQTGLDGLMSRPVDAHAYDGSIVSTEASRGVMNPMKLQMPTHHRWGLLLLDSNQQVGF